MMAELIDPRSKVLSSDEETVEILEIIEDCDDYSDLDEDEASEYEFDYEENY